MALADICHNTDIRAGDAAEIMHFPEMVDTHFQHGYLRIFRHGQHGKRYSHFIIIVAQGFVHLIFHGEHGCNEFLRAGLSDASGNSHHFDRQLLPIEFPDLFQGLKAVLHDDTGTG